MPLCSQDNLHGAVHAPRLPLRPPTHDDMKHRPETQKHIEPSTKTSVSIPLQSEICLISSEVNSLANTARVKPNFPASFAPFAEVIASCVEA